MAAATAAAAAAVMTHVKTRISWTRIAHDKCHQKTQLSKPRASLSLGPIEPSFMIINIGTTIITIISIISAARECVQACVWVR